MGDDEKGYLEHAWRLNINLNRKHAPVANEAAGVFFCLSLHGVLEYWSNGVL
jgi:hypothetical protein